MRAKIKISIAALVLPAALLLFNGCSGPDRGQAERPGLNLIQLHQAARQLRESGRINLASPLSNYYLKHGWSHPYSENDGPATTVAVSQDAVFRFKVVRPADRWFIFYARCKDRYGGPRFQQFDVIVSGEKVGSFELKWRDDFMEKQIFIPEKLQRRGDNEVLFKFSVFDNNKNFLANKRKHERFPHPGVAAYFREFSIRPGDSAGPLGASRDELNTFELSPDGKGLRQWPNSELSYAFEVKEDSRLALEGSVFAAAKDVRDDLSIEVQARTDDDPDWNVLWSSEFEISPSSSAHSFKENVELDEIGGELAEIKISVYASSLFSKASVDWRKMRLEFPEGLEEEAEEEEGEEREAIHLDGKAKNVVIIVLDAARPDHFGYHGNTEGMTPNIDRLAEKSIIFENAIAQAPYTLASISTLFSSLNPEAHGARSLPREEEVEVTVPEEGKTKKVKRVVGEAFPQELENMARAFNRSGYYTLALAGSKFIREDYGITRDCDEVVYLRTDEYIKQRVSTMDVDLMRSGLEKAKKSGKPVFVYAHYLPPHWPYRPPKPFNNRYVSNPKLKHWPLWEIKELLDHRLNDEAKEDIATHHKRYKNNLYYADAATQQLLDLLKEFDLYEDSLIIISSDHGEAFAQYNHGEIPAAGAADAFGGVRHIGHNTTVYDEMIWVPLVVYFPGAKPARIEQQVGLIDIFPTLIELFDLESDDESFQGRSIAPLLVGEDMEPAGYYYSRAVGPDPYFTMRGSRLKYVHHHYFEAMYDLKSDPHETVNIIEKHPVLATYLRQRALLMIAYNAGLRGDEGEEFTINAEDAEDLRGIGYLQ